ncbi:MAG TPA: DUF4332 domain-containing protein [Aggregatilineaceae bacterium]|nr:DUF4332 domain-containing protein [Aggregatilineaceae bacterium]
MFKTVRNLAVLGAGLSASAIVGWLLLRDKKRDPNGATTIIKSYADESAAVAQIVLPREALDDAEPEDIPTGDDLTQIKGIGPRYAEALQRVGITQYMQLAKQNPDDLAARLAAHVTITAQRIRERDWIGQAAQLAQK